MMLTEGAPVAGDTVDAVAGGGCGCFGGSGRFGFGEAHCLGEVHGFLLVNTVKLLKEVSLGLFGGCFPSGGLRHSPCPGGVRGRGRCCEEIRVKTRATAFGGRFGRVIGIRVIGIRVNGSVRYRVRCVKIRNEEAELFFKEPAMPERFASLPLVWDSDCAVFGVANMTSLRSHGAIHTHALSPRSSLHLVAGNPAV